MIQTVDKDGEIAHPAKAAKTLSIKVNFNLYYKSIYTIQYRNDFSIIWSTLILRIFNLI